MARNPKTTVRSNPRKDRRFSIGDYEAEARPLGRGGMATVYRATAPSGRTVAIKELIPHLRSDRKMARRFRQEFDVVSRLRHANIVRFEEFVVANDTHNIVMEYVDGTSLRDVLKRTRRLEAPLMAGLGHQLASAVHAIHGEGVLHRDLKPGNVLFAADGTLKLTDFGIAHQEGTRLTATGMVLGSPAYMSPEQLSGKRDAVDARTDVYALGVMLYECVEGADPFRVPAHEDLLSVLNRKRETQPRPMKHCGDPGFEALLLQCLRVDPAERPADMGEVARRLAGIAEQGAGSGTPAPGGRALGKQLMEIGAAPKRKPARRKAVARGKVPRATTTGSIVRLKERRAFIWICLAAAAALAAAAFLLGDGIGG